MSKPESSFLSREGTSRQPSSTQNRIPAPATASPTGVKSNMPKLSAPDCARNPETIRFGGVPMSVVMPPRIVPNDNGIRTLPGGSSCLAAIWMAIGISSAMAPTLFMNADSAAPRPVSAAIASIGPAPRGRIVRARASTTPVLCKP